MVFMEKDAVDSKFDDIADIEMVLVDKKGAKVHATIRKQLIYMFESKIEAEKVYEMSYSSVFSQSGFYRTTVHTYKLVFQVKTKVTLSESSVITQVKTKIISSWLLQDILEIELFKEEGIVRVRFVGDINDLL